MNDQPQPNDKQQPEHEHEHGHEQHEQEPELRPRIYAASLSDYNAGRLHGTWIDAAQPAEDLHADIAAMLDASPEPGAEEWAIHDYEGFGPLHVGEYEPIDQLAEVARGIAEHGPAFAAWAAHVGTSDSEALERFEDCFLGRWDSIEAYAEELVDDIGITSAVEEAGGSLAAYVRIDTAALARDMVADGSLSTAEAPDGGVYLFGP